MLKSVRGTGFAVVLCLIVAGSSGAAWAQKRKYAAVEPNKDNTVPNLVFDVNIFPDDNISPNIVVSRDGKKGFVGYAGSGVVVAFSFDTGEILSRIETGGKPQFATPLPDGNTMAVTSVWDNRIFMIDMNTMAVVGTFAFARAQFGFGSIVTTSSDGATGYVSSTGTGEVIKFSLVDGKELGRLRGMLLPAQITLSLDDATLMIVDAEAEELVFADASSLSRKTALQARNIGVDFTIFNRAVLAPDGLTGLIASRNPSGIAFVFRTSTGEILESLDAGFYAGFTGLTPDGNQWVIFNQLGIEIIPVADPKSVRNLTIPFGEPLGSSNMVFSPDSRFAFYALANINSTYQHDLDADSILWRMSGDSLILEQPSSIAITPDGSRIAVLNFVSNNIDLLTDATILEAARFASSTDRFTGLSLINLSRHSSRVTITAMDNFGILITGEEINNPAEIVLDPNHQISNTLAQIFNLDPEQEYNGWLSIVSEQPEIAGYLSIGDDSLNRVDGIPLFKKRLHEWIVPEIVRQEGYSVEMNTVNPNHNLQTYDLERVAPDGTVIDTRSANQGFPTNLLSQVFGEFFADPEESTDGYLRASSAGGGMLFTEFFGGDNTSAALNGIDTTRFSGITKIYSPQFAIFPGFKTLLNLINAGGEEAEVTITLYAPDGSVLAEPLRKTLVRDGQIKDNLADIFALDPSQNVLSGWLEIESTRDRIIGTVTFTNDDNTYLTSFELCGSPSSDLLFPMLAHDGLYQTGLAILNANSEPAQVTLEVWGPGGKLDSTSFAIRPKSRIAAYLESYFPSLASSLSGNIRIHSDRPLVGFALINDRNFNFMAAVPSIPLN